MEFDSGKLLGTLVCDSMHGSGTATAGEYIIPWNFPSVCHSLSVPVADMSPVAKMSTTSVLTGFG